MRARTGTRLYRDPASATRFFNVPKDNEIFDSLLFRPAGGNVEARTESVLVFPADPAHPDPARADRRQVSRGHPGARQPDAYRLRSYVYAYRSCDPAGGPRGAGRDRWRAGHGQARLDGVDGHRPPQPHGILAGRRRRHRLPAGGARPIRGGVDEHQHRRRQRAQPGPGDAGELHHAAPGSAADVRWHAGALPAQQTRLQQGDPDRSLARRRRRGQRRAEQRWSPAGHEVRHPVRGVNLADRLHRHPDAGTASFGGHRPGAALPRGLRLPRRRRRRGRQRRSRVHRLRIPPLRPVQHAPRHGLHPRRQPQPVQQGLDDERCGPAHLAGRAGGSGEGVHRRLGQVQRPQRLAAGQPVQRHDRKRARHAGVPDVEVRPGPQDHRALPGRRPHEEHADGPRGEAGLRDRGRDRQRQPAGSGTGGRRAAPHLPARRSRHEGGAGRRTAPPCAKRSRRRTRTSTPSPT